MMSAPAIVRRATLQVSARATIEYECTRANLERMANQPSIELCAGCTLEVTDRTDGNETLCILRDGREVWIEERWL